MGRKEDNIKKAQALMNKPKQIRNLGICAHIDHGKTTLSDNLIAGAGMMSEELAGKQLLLDFDEQEQARGITINAANASMVHDYEGQEYLINLIDTPGHVDFGGDVTRAMRAVDGSIVLACAVEGVMPQTETVIRQSLKERVKPLLFINKVDRLINELEVTPEQMQARFIKIITEVNGLINKMVPAEFKKEWSLRVEEGSVAFGSAYHNWAISVPYMKESGITFKDIFEYCKQGKQKELAKKAPIHKILLDMAIDHHPNPLDAQKYRIPNIWHGDPESKIGKSMTDCNPNGPVAFMVTKIVLDPHAGEVAIGRLFSGTIKRGENLHILGMPNPNRTQQVSLSVGADRISVESICAGNIVAVTGLKDAIAGSTVSDDPEMEAFEKIVHYSEPVVTVAIEAKLMKDLPKLVEVLRSVAKADPSIQVEINQETGEHLMSGMGELHLEITEYRIKNEHKVEIKSSLPIVVYRESVDKLTPKEFEGKSPNKHNKFYITTEPLEENIIEFIKSGKVPSEGGRIKDARGLMMQMQELGMSKDEAKGIVAIFGPNLFIDMTKGIQNLHETMELCREGYIEVMKKGPLADERVMGVKVKLMDAKLHEDTIHRGPAQVIPAIRQGICGAMCLSGRVLLEPKQKVQISVPQDVMGAATREMQQRRSVIEDMTQEGDMVTIKSKAPVSEMFGFSNSIRSVTGGRAMWSTENCGFEKIPRELLDEVVGKIRTRKGLKAEPYDAAYYTS
ncbi:MAG: elongation factor EF-2 [Candidatus Thermoplasmatota archaeon]|nr:elongation factor EF-2 [Euryarchaeota archaeon]MBU4032379.1 elongation factor EF-2 [Candidatus Thermoplasmatota archaeon]MBU4144804.1 elongation factor EF-2 [Candidatus Thermoplasmatota archaeon]MBU4591626.1 elongation factor EF-2 [Candidatus Thermoplasmatota archaeon]